MGDLIRVLLVLLLLLSPAGSASAAPAPAPAPPAATGLQVEDICIRIGTNSESMACLANLSLSCLAAGAVTVQTVYLACFLGGYMAGQCLAGPRRRPEKSCIGIGFNDERVGCLALVGWSCEGSSFGDVGFVACFLGSSIKCALF